MLADYGAFRDLQRHRMLTIEWQRLSPRHGYTRPEAVELAGQAAAFDAAMERSAALHDALVERFPAQASYAVCLAYKVRFVLDLNAREAMHLIELRSTPQGHPAYRLVAQEMHRLIAEEAGHHAVAEMMRFVDHSPEPSLERLDAERRAAIVFGATDGSLEHRTAHHVARGRCRVRRAHLARQGRRAPPVVVVGHAGIAVAAGSGKVAVVRGRRRHHRLRRSGPPAQSLGIGAAATGLAA